MKRLSVIFILSLCMSFVFFVSCKSDTKNTDLSFLPGKWNIVKAKRNGNVTNTLDNAYMFFNDKTFEHNLNGDTVSLEYNLSDNTINLDDSLLGSLKIVKLINDTLEINTKISSLKFNFLLEKDESN